MTSEVIFLILVIMAAGAGSRYGGPKQLAALGPNGERLFDYAVFDAVRSGFARVVFVVREPLEREFQSIADDLATHLPSPPRVVVQRLDDLPAGHVPAQRLKPWGTGHAVLAARDELDGPFAVVNADDFYGPHAYQLSVTAGRLGADRGLTTIIGMRLADTLSENGPVTRAVCAVNDGRVTSLDEVHDIVRHNGELVGSVDGRSRVLTGEELVSMNFWVCPPSMVANLQAGFEAFLRDASQDNDAEFRLPEAISALAARGGAAIQAVHAAGPWFGLTHAEDRSTVAAGLRRLAEQGAYPTPLWKSGRE